MKSKVLQWASMALVVEIGVLHLYMAPHEFEETRYLGILFAVNFILALIGALRMLRDELLGWAIGLFLAAASMGGYVLSRTAGLPGMEVEPWTHPVGLISLAVEACFVAAFFLRRPWEKARRLDAAGLEPALAGLPRLLLPFYALAVVMVVTLFAVQLDSNSRRHEADSSMAAVSDLKPVSLSRFEEQYGVRVTLVAVSAMDSIIDLRMKIVDVEKARGLLADHAHMPFLVVGEHDPLVIMPARMSHHMLNIKKDGMYVMFFPNLKQAVRSGSEVSLAFGDVRAGSISVK